MITPNIFVDLDNVRITFEHVNQDHLAQTHNIVEEFYKVKLTKA